MALIDDSVLTQPDAIDQFAARLAGDERLAHVERLAPRPARFAELSDPLADAVVERLPIEGFWSHQAEAIDLLRAGRSVAIATGTASGKSLCYQAPIADAVHRAAPPTTALALFPTKALAQDQLRALAALEVPGVVATTYDGDSSAQERTWARAHANVIFTNPEMLHVGVLPQHARWATFLMRLRYVVVDELHLLRGVFGSHVAHLLRRLRRVCAHYGSDPTFVFTSATIGEPAELASSLCGKPVTAVTDDGSPRGQRLFVLWNPADDEGRRSAGSRESARLTAELVSAGHRTLTFCASRKGTEVLANDVRRRLGAGLAERVRPYRGGYLSEERRTIERALFGGELLGVVATTALEHGIDVGGLDAVVLAGFPGTVSSMWQQAGRAGRATQASVAVLVAGDDQLDQWLMCHPTEIFTRPPEPAVVNPANDHVLLPHLACAAFELPLRPADERWWPDLLDEGVRRLVADDRLKLRPRRGPGPDEPTAYWSGRGAPAPGIGLRSTDLGEYRIALADGTLVGTVGAGRAFRQVHPGAVYLHQGRSFQVSSLDLDDQVAIVEPADGSTYTQPRSHTDLGLMQVDCERDQGGVVLGLGDVRVRSEVIGYKRFDVSTGELLGSEELFLPPNELETRGFWWAIEPPVIAEAGIDPARLPGTLHALEHAAIGVLPLFTICDRWDVGGVSTPLLVDTGRPTIVVYDGYPGGAGVAELAHHRADEILAAALEVIDSCGCLDGCPSCVQSPKCGNGNEPLDKVGAARLAEALLAAVE